MKLTAAQIQEAIEKYPYWDERVLGIDCLHYGDEVTIYYPCDNYQVAELTFSQCYYILFDHFEGYDKGGNVRELSLPQIPYFLQNIRIVLCSGEEAPHSPPLYEATIDCSPALVLKIRFRNFSIQRVEKARERQGGDFHNPIW